MKKRPVVLIIMDGFGLNDNPEGNAVAQASTPVLDALMNECPWQKGLASGLAVGLPDGQMGNSEVGHMNMGAGRIVYQELTRITKEIEDGDFFENEALKGAFARAKEKGGKVHLYGLLSDGGVHSHNTHLYGLLEMAKREGVDQVYVHGFFDGRDTDPRSGLGFVNDLEAKMQEIGAGKIASVTGRYYAMDRDNRWDRVEKAYRLLTLGEGKTAASAPEAIQASYDADVTDEFIEPTAITDGDGKPLATVADGDSIIFFNFRPDRAREITRAFCADDFDSFDRGAKKDLFYVCFTEYDATIPNTHIAFRKVELNNTFGQYLANLGLKQARIAETEKYAHVTFFFNGGVEAPYEGEDRVLVRSPQVATYDLKPEMSAWEVCDKLTTAIRSGKYDAIICNFANPDMVGHTGKLDAAIKAVETVDDYVGRAVQAAQEMDGAVFICADHGNCEQEINYETGAPWTAHTTNPVPFLLYVAGENGEADPSIGLKEGGRLCDIIPTMLELMGLEQPKEMTGESLIIHQ